jgi:hypothetical protein
MTCGLADRFDTKAWEEPAASLFREVSLFDPEERGSKFFHNFIYPSPRNMEAAGTSKTLIPIYQTT